MVYIDDVIVIAQFVSKVVTCRRRTHQFNSLVIGKSIAQKRDHLVGVVNEQDTFLVNHSL